MCVTEHTRLFNTSTVHCAQAVAAWTRAAIILVKAPCVVGTHRVASMINVSVIVWLLTGGMIGSLAVLDNHFSMAPLFLSFTAAMVILIVLGLIRRQPVR
jgi:hypothetical protein